MKGRHMVFDVESVGLHGEGFAVAWIVLQDGERVDEGYAYCDPTRAVGTKEGRVWVDENVELHTTPLGRATRPVVCTCPEEVREVFWKVWQAERKKGTSLWADVPWPVESFFLEQCVEDARPPGVACSDDLDPTPREWEGPYPLYDVATFMLAKNGESCLEHPPERRPDEEPVHHPLADARQSARLLVEAMKEK